MQKKNVFHPRQYKIHYQPKAIKANRSNNQLEDDNDGENEEEEMEEREQDNPIHCRNRSNNFPLLWDTSMLYLPSSVVSNSTIPGHPWVKEDKINNHMVQEKVGIMLRIIISSFNKDTMPPLQCNSDYAPKKCIK